MDLFRVFSGFLMAVSDQTWATSITFLFCFPPLCFGLPVMKKRLLVAWGCTGVGHREIATSGWPDLRLTHTLDSQAWRFLRPALHSTHSSTAEQDQGQELQRQVLLSPPGPKHAWLISVKAFMSTFKLLVDGCTDDSCCSLEDKPLNFLVC